MKLKICILGVLFGLNAVSYADESENILHLQSYNRIRQISKEEFRNFIVEEVESITDVFNIETVLAQEMGYPPQQEIFFSASANGQTYHCVICLVFISALGDVVLKNCRQSNQIVFKNSSLRLPSKEGRIVSGREVLR